VYHDTLFDRFARWTSRTVGYPVTFAAAVLINVVWAITGPLFGFSNMVAERTPVGEMPREVEEP
jgi:low affinity Fe/Cu permease